MCITQVSKVRFAIIMENLVSSSASHFSVFLPRDSFIAIFVLKKLIWSHVHCLLSGYRIRRKSVRITIPNASSYSIQRQSHSCQTG